MLKEGSNHRYQRHQWNRKGLTGLHIHCFVNAWAQISFIQEIKLLQTLDPPLETLQLTGFNKRLLFSHDSSSRFDVNSSGGSNNNKNPTWYILCGGLCSRHFNIILSDIFWTITLLDTPTISFIGLKLLSLSSFHTLNVFSHSGLTWLSYQRSLSW